LAAAWPLRRTGPEDRRRSFGSNDRAVGERAERPPGNIGRAFLRYVGGAEATVYPEAKIAIRAHANLWNEPNPKEFAVQTHHLIGLSKEGAGFKHYEFQPSTISGTSS
jgi:hypothetical protein